ncbi:MAG: hypothetical protein DWQ05_14010 [Calditrichaeota bacterium]|nr:MAG: hypothetical protein DWQ05_14010 [Calditrichota bacterium]
MKRFRFSLQQVLNLKASQKFQIENELASLHRQKNQIEESLSELTKQWQAENDALSLNKRKSLDSDYRIRVAYLEFLDQQFEVENKTLLNVMKQISTTQEKLATIIQEEKVIKKLRDKRFDEFVSATKKEEQAINDDLVNQKVIQQILNLTRLTEHNE